jgi:hypothetical protein
MEVAELFSDAHTTAERGDRLEELKKAFDEAITRRDSGADRFTEKHGIIKGAGTGKGGLVARAVAFQERMGTLTKGLSDEDAQALRGELDALKAMTDDLAKDITVASPGDLHPYDLEAPAKILVPRFTPLRNQIPRQKGQGTAREYRRILGWTNTGMGGVADMAPFFNSESDSGTPTFGSLALRRGQKISYAMDVHTAAYQEMSVSSLVTYKAQFANLGFENTRALDQMALLWSHLLGEEKAILYGRGASGSGYEGPISAPVLTSAVGASTGGTIGAATYYVKVTARGGYGESVVSNEVNTGVLSGSTNKITVTVGTEPTGALGYNLYVGTSTGTETFQTSFVGNSYVLTSYAGGGAAMPGADTSANSNAYDGLVTVLADPAQSGYVARVNSDLYSSGEATPLGDKPFQDAFASLWASVYADPEEVWTTAPVRRELADFVKSSAGGAAGYRIVIPDPTFQSGTNVGGIVSGIVNESSPTSRIVDLNVHPYMPAGVAVIRSRHLNIPDSGIADTSVMTMVQDYMSVDWPSIQFTYDSSTYAFGTLIHYAPKWSGILLGIQ